MVPTEGQTDWTRDGEGNEWCAGVWQNIHCGRVGLRPVKTSAVRDERGDFCKDWDALLSQMALYKAAFKDKDLSITTKRLVYVSAVLGTLLYGPETWAIATKSKTNKKLESSVYHCRGADKGADNNSTGETKVLYSLNESSLILAIWPSCLQCWVITEGTHSEGRMRWLGHMAKTRFPNSSFSDDYIRHVLPMDQDWDGKARPGERTLESRVQRWSRYLHGQPEWQRP